MLAVNRKRRCVVAILAGLVLAAGGFLFFWPVTAHVPAFRVFDIAYTVCGLWVAMRLFDQVTVVDRRNPRYCPSCRYDLHGTIQAGIMRCPECGRPISCAPAGIKI